MNKKLSIFPRVHHRHHPRTIAKKLHAQTKNQNKQNIKIEHRTDRVEDHKKTHLEEDVPEGRPAAQHVEVLLVVLEAGEAGYGIDELHVRQVPVALEVVEERRVLAPEVL